MPQSLKIDVKGLKEFRSALRKAGREFPVALRQANREAANVVLPEAKRRGMASRSNLAGGRATLGSKGVASIRVLASQSKAQLAGGGARVPWFGGSEYGSSGAHRQFPARNSDGYILWPAAKSKQPQVIEVYDKALDNLSKRAFPN